MLWVCFPKEFPMELPHDIEERLERRWFARHIQEMEIRQRRKL